MTQFTLAARSHIRNAVLCTLATMTLVACGDTGSSSGAATSDASDTAASLVSPGAGVIDRSSGLDTPSTETTAAVSTAAVASPGATASSSATVASTGTVATTPIAAPTNRTTIQNPAPVSGPSSTSNTTVASGTRVGTPVTAPISTTPTSGTPVTSTPTVKATTTNGVATLDWMPPTENSDGSVLTDLAGYTVYYGTSAGNLTQSIKVTNPGLAAYTVTNMTSGTWYFAVTSVSSTGVESTRTSAISITI